MYMYKWQVHILSDYRYIQYVFYICTYVYVRSTSINCKKLAINIYGENGINHNLLH